MGFLVWPFTTYKRSPEPIIEVDALVDRATDLRVSRIEPPALVVLGRDVGGGGLATIDGEVPLLNLKFFRSRGHVQMTSVLRGGGGLANF